MRLQKFNGFDTYKLLMQWRRSQVKKWGIKYWEEWMGGV